MATKQDLREMRKGIMHDVRVEISEAIDPVKDELLPIKDELTDLRKRLVKLELNEGQSLHGSSSLSKEFMDLLNATDPANKQLTFIFPDQISADQRMTAIDKINAFCE